ncbi:MAG: PqiC family protein [Polyangiaceae bacterium]
MKRSSTARVILVAGAMACGSSPPSTFYALVPEAGVAHSAYVHTIRLRRPGIPAYLDRPEVVQKVADFRLGLVDSDRWAAPLDEMLGRVLAQDIEQRFRGTSVFVEDGPITADADATIEVDVRRFDVGDAGRLHLLAEVAVENGVTHAPVGTRAVSLEQAPVGGTTVALVSAMSDLVGKLADQTVALVCEATLAHGSNLGSAATSAR